MLCTVHAVHVRVHAYINLFMHAYIHACICAYVYVLHTYVHVCMSVCMCVCSCMHARICSIGLKQGYVRTYAYLSGLISPLPLYRLRLSEVCENSSPQ